MKILCGIIGIRSQIFDLLFEQHFAKRLEQKTPLFEDYKLLVLFCHANIYQVFSQQTYAWGCGRFGNTQLSNFNLIKYMKKWYIHAVIDYSDVFQEDCLTSEYYATGEGTAKITEQGKNVTTGIWSTVNSLMQFNDATKGNYEYQIPSQNVYDWLIDIISTDYKTYSIEWSCLPNPSSGSDVYIWIMSPARSIDWRFWAKVNPILRRHKINKTHLRTVKHDEATCSA